MQCLRNIFSIFSSYEWLFSGTDIISIFKTPAIFQSSKNHDFIIDFRQFLILLCYEWLCFSGTIDIISIFKTPANCKEFKVVDLPKESRFHHWSLDASLKIDGFGNYFASKRTILLLLLWTVANYNQVVIPVTWEFFFEPRPDSRSAAQQWCLSCSFQNGVLTPLQMFQRTYEGGDT